MVDAVFELLGVDAGSLPGSLVAVITALFVLFLVSVLKDLVFYLLEGVR